MPVDVEVTRPAWLLALPLLAAALVIVRLPWWRAGKPSPASLPLRRRPRRPRENARRAFSALRESLRPPAARAEARRLVVRLVWLALPVLALAGLTIARPLDRLATVFVLDHSASVASVRDVQEAAVRAALARLEGGDVAGVVATGASASVVQPLAVDPMFQEIAAPAAGASDLAAGIALAAGLVPANRTGRIVLLSDGRETSGDAVAAARSLAARGVTVDVLPVGPDAIADVRLDRVDAPETAREGESSVLRVAITASRAAAAAIRVYRDGALILEQPHALRAGEHEVAFALPPAEPGVHRLRVEVDAENADADATPLNNALGAVQRVLGAPTVLVLATEPARAGFLPHALRVSGAEVRVATPAALPADLAGIASYDAVVIADVPADALPPGAMPLLERYVRELGRGLVMTGGPDAFGPGGYADTPIEEALPVYMDLRGRGRKPRVALVLVIDRSGSMQGLKIEMAKEAAVRSARLLEPEDQAGVIAFAALPQWVVPIAPVSDAGSMEKAVGSIYAGGGTEVFPAVFAAFQALREVDADVKHLIVLTDGHSSSGGDYASLIEGMRDENMTLSSVAVGQDADRALLAALARGGRGRAHVANDPSQLPQIFTEETIMATRTILVDARFFPAAASASPMLRGVDRVARLDGYVAVTPKERAEVVLVSPDGDPVLAAWQHGAGRTLAWMPDLGGRWSAAWARDESASRLWGNALSWLLPPPDQGELVARIEPEPNGFALHVENRTAWDTVRATTAAIIGPAGRRISIDLAPAGPGRYRAPLPALDAAPYVIQVHQRIEQEAEITTEIGWAAPYPAEYRAIGIDRGTLARIAEAGGGRVLEDAADAVRPPDRPSAARWPLAPLLLVLAAIAWPLDVASRRLPPPSMPDWARHAAARLRPGIRATPRRGAPPVQPRSAQPRATPAASSTERTPPEGGDATADRLLERTRRLRHRRRAGAREQ